MSHIQPDNIKINNKILILLKNEYKKKCKNNLFFFAIKNINNIKYENIYTTYSCLYYLNSNKWWILFPRSRKYFCNIW